MKKALLIIDIQNDYFESGKMTLVGSDKAADYAKLLLEHFRKESLAVIHIQHLAAGTNASFFLPNTEGAKIHQKVKPLASEKVFQKHYPNCFRETELLNYLKDNQISELTICGMMTHMCIDASTRAAYDLGFKCTLIGDACATKALEFMGQSVSAKDVQNAFLSAINGTFADVKTTEEFVNRK